MRTTQKRESVERRISLIWSSMGARISTSYVMVTAQKDGGAAADRPRLTEVKTPCHTSCCPPATALPVQPHLRRQSSVPLSRALPSVLPVSPPSRGTLSSVLGLPPTRGWSSTSPVPTAKRWARPPVGVKSEVFSLRVVWGGLRGVAWGAAELSGRSCAPACGAAHPEPPGKLA